MMRIEAGLAFLVLVCSSASAKVAVSFGAAVLNYKSDFSEGRTSDHRSGLAARKAAPLFDGNVPTTDFSSGLDNPEDPALASQVWRSSYIPEYEVAHSGEDEIKGMLASSLKSAGLSEYTYAADEDLFRFASREDSSDFVPRADASLPEDVLVKEAEKHAKKHLKAFKGRIEFDNVEVGYMNNRIHDVRVRYRRIFKNGIVLRDISYAYVKVDGSGKLKEVRVKWPLFRKIPGWEPARGISTAVTLAGTEFANLSDATRGVEIMHPKKAAINGMAAAWYPVDSEGSVRITPCYSFAADIEFDSGAVEKTFVQVPLLEKYVAESEGSK